jgi:hypothetical protein
MTVVVSQTQLTAEASAVPLARYAYITGYQECRFWGVSGSPEPDEPCRVILSKMERDMIAKYLHEAQDEIEQVCDYHLNPQWDANEEHDYFNPVRARWGRVIAPGVRAESDIALGEAVDDSADPHVVGPIVTTVTNVDEVYVFHPGTDVEINPSFVEIVGGALTIEIPRCRTVTQAAYSAGGDIDYATDANFEATVDVKRIYNDESTQGVLIWTHGENCNCGSTCCNCQCEEETETACLGIRNAEIGALNILRADYSNGTWARVSLSCSCTSPQKVRLNYYSGMTPLTPQAEDAIVRLAHAKMPEPPCGCNVLQDLWKRDRNVPTVLTAERLNCPFGLNDGAWIAWRFANIMRLVRSGLL